MYSRRLASLGVGIVARHCDSAANGFKPHSLPPGHARHAELRASVLSRRVHTEPRASTPSHARQQVAWRPTILFAYSGQCAAPIRAIVAPLVDSGTRNMFKYARPTP